MDASNETWRDIVGYEGLYEVSDLGRVRNVVRRNGTFPGRILKQHDTGYYLQVNLYKSGKGRFCSVHRLVAAAFLGECSSECVVNHKDGDKKNPRLDNLEYLTRSENGLHAFAVGLNHRGEKHGQAKLSDVQIAEIDALIGTMSLRKIGAIYGVSGQTILNIKKRKCWQHIEAPIH